MKLKALSGILAAAFAGRSSSFSVTSFRTYFFLHSTSQEMANKTVGVLGESGSYPLYLFAAKY